jgi:hypothetical protein
MERVARLRDAKPRVVELLEQHCPDVVEEIANELADSFGATRKFVEFTLKFLPCAPEVRPPEGFQIPWDEIAFAKMLRMIYSYRSKALHTGIPFPAPMCEPPNKAGEGLTRFMERPDGLATSTMGSVWRQEDTPMLLHIFEYITRNVLKSWWLSLPVPPAGEMTEPS